MMYSRWLSFQGSHTKMNSTKPLAPPGGFKKTLRKKVITAKKVNAVQAINTKKARRKLAKLKPILDPHTADYMHLIANPCKGPLVRVPGSALGNSIIERVRSTISLPTTATNNNGYIMWFPSYVGNGNSEVNPGPTYTPGNLYLFQNASTSVSPSNTTALPMGLDSVTTTGVFLADPSLTSISTGSAFSRAKCVAACSQLEFLGALSTCSGQVAIISNATLSNINQNVGASGQEFIPPSIDQVFSYAAYRERLQLDGHEVVWRPSDATSVLRSYAAGYAGAAQTSVADTVFWTGQKTVVPTHVSCMEPRDACGIIIAWKGVPAIANSISLNFIKVIELELAARSNNIETTCPNIESGTSVADSVHLLDELKPSWQTGSVAASMAAAMAALKVYNNYAPAGMTFRTTTDRFRNTQNSFRV